MANNNSTAVKQVKENSEDTNKNSMSSSSVSENKLKNTEASDKAENIRKYLDDKKDIVNEYAQNTIHKVNELSQRASEVFTGSADYVKNFDFDNAKKQLETRVKEKPGMSLVIAGGLGLLIGLIIKKRR